MVVNTELFLHANGQRLRYTRIVAHSLFTLLHAYSLGKLLSLASTLQRTKDYGNLFLKGLSSCNLQSLFTIYYEEFEGADHESATYFCVSFIVSNLYAFEV